jgi:Tellurite resistance protein TerB
MNTTSSFSISPEKINLLQIVCAIAWADGELAIAEKELMLNQFSQLFSEAPREEQKLRQELEIYVAEKIDLQVLEQLVAKLETEEDRELMIKLGYLVIRASQPTDIRSSINPKEKLGYRRLVELLALPESTIEKIEWIAEEDLKQHDNVLNALTSGITRFLTKIR